MEKLVSLVNQTREDNNVHENPIYLHIDLASATSTPNDIIDDVFIIHDSPTFFLKACEHEEGKRSEEDVSVYVDQFDELSISDGEEPCEEDVIEFTQIENVFDFLQNLFSFFSKNFKHNSLSPTPKSHNVYIVGKRSLKNTKSKENEK